MAEPTASSVSNDCAVAAVRLSCLCKNFGSLSALADLDVQIGAGELFGFVGPDGAGKTTLLRILAGVKHSTSGEARIFDEDPRQARLRVGYLTQHFSLYSELSIDENLKYYAGVRNVSRANFEQRREALLQRVGLSEFRNRIAGHLSGGMRQKLALCCVLMSDPDLLLLDEPTTGLDPLSRGEVWQLIRELVTDGKTVVIATPHFDEGQRCSRVALMQGGRILAAGPPSELIKQLGSTRLEIRCDKLQAATRLLLKAQERPDIAFNEMNVYGDRVDLISVDPAVVQSDVQTMLSQAGMSSYTVSFAEPTLENVFIASLRARGFVEPECPPFPFAGASAQIAGEIAIEARQLGKRFGHFTAVDKV
ncbi:MAG TPA: ABC transporter ATP-binding protein, partial [Candidatus Obscuribacterales bacterium]